MSKSYAPKQTITAGHSIQIGAVELYYEDCAKRGDEQIHQLIKQFNALGDDYEDMNFTAQSLSAITAATLVIHGDSDNFFPFAVQRPPAFSAAMRLKIIKAPALFPITASPAVLISSRCLAYIRPY